MAGGPTGTEVRYAQFAGQYLACPVSSGREVSGFDLPSVDPCVLHLYHPLLYGQDLEVESGCNERPVLEL